VTDQAERASGTAEASVLDHRFGSTALYTLGVEEEYMLLDPETWDLVQRSRRSRRASSRRGSTPS